MEEVALDAVAWEELVQKAAQYIHVGAGMEATSMSSLQKEWEAQA